MFTIDITDLSDTALEKIIAERRTQFRSVTRLYRAWRLYIRLNYTWSLAWHKALREEAPEKALNDAMFKMNALLRRRYPMAGWNSA
jgi:hypothetical protein